MVRAQSDSGSVTLEWDEVPNVAGYRIRYGTTKTNLDQSHDAGPETETVVAGLLPGTRYWFAATAYDAVGVESEFSNMIQYPGKVVGLVWPEWSSAYPGGDYQWEPLSPGPIATFIHGQGGQGFVYRLRIAQTNDYSP